jgi:hypothetical protein
MPSKFFTLASSLLLVAAVHAAAQQPPAPTPRPKLGYVRFWNMLPPSAGTFSLRRAGAGAEATLATASAYAYPGYMELPAGRYRFTVHRASQGDTPLRTLDVELADNMFVTVLVSPRGGGAAIDVFDDTVPPEAASGTVVIRNYFEGTTVEVAGKQPQLKQTLGYGESHVATDLGGAAAQIVLRTKLPNGKPAESELELDFKAAKRATLLIIPDSYGRFRPRVTADGQRE